MSLRKNVISSFLLSASTILFPLVVFPFITRVLSNANIGKVFFIDAFTQYFIIFSSIGVPFYGVREIAKIKNDAKQRSLLVTELVIINVCLSVFYCLLFLLLHFIVPSLKNELLLIQIACIAIIANSFLIEWFYQGIENFAYITKRSLLLKGIAMVFILAFIKGKNDYAIYYLIMALLALTNAGLNFYYFITNHFHKFNISQLRFKRHFKSLLVLFSINISLSIYTVLDTIILGLLSDTKNVSYYNVPLKLAKVFWSLVGGISTVLIPKMSSMVAENNKEGIRLLMNKSFNIVFLLTLPFCFFCLRFPGEILTIVSGSQYQNAENALRILSVVPLIIGICNVLGTQFLLPMGQENKVLYATVFGLIVSLVLNFALIPYFTFIGTSIACVCAELVVCAYVCLQARKHIHIAPDISLVLQILLSIVCCFLFSLVAKAFLNPYMLIGTTFIIYMVAMLTLQFFVFKNTFLYSLINFKKRAVA